MTPDLQPYLRDIRQLSEQVESTPELSLREPLLKLIRSLAGDASRSGLVIAPEANAEEAGQPDVYVKDGPRLVGFLETKAPGAELRRLLRSDKQLKRYRQSLPNWILTDYYDFVLLREGEVLEPRVTIAEIGSREPSDHKAAQRLVDLFASFLAYTPPVIRSPKRLAVELARRARLLRDGLEGALRLESTSRPLRGVLSFYQETLMNDLDEPEFADTFAQTIVYGMFLSRLRESSGNPVATQDTDLP